MRRFLWLWLIVVGSLAVASAQVPNLRFPVEVVLDRTAYTAGSTVRGLVSLKINKPYHVNANPASEDYLIPTELRFPEATGFKVEKVVYPKPIEKAFGFSEGKPLKIYEGQVVIQFELTLAEDVSLGELPIKASVRYQACDDNACYPPRTVPAEFKIKVDTRPGEENPRYKELLKKISEPQAPEPKTEESGRLQEYSSQGWLVETLIQQFESGRWMPFVLLIFVAGLGLNLTPCVLPMISITLGFFSMQARGQAGMRAGLSALYALSMAMMYALLGTVASLAGKAFGFQLQNPIVTGVLVGLLVLFALALFGVYKFQVPPALMQYVGARQGWIGAVLMGCLAGVAAAPCIGPVIAALIPIVAALANPTLGFLLFFALGLGLGTPYFIAGLFYERVQTRLPRSGEWTILVERIFGVLLLAVALFFANSLMSITVYQWAWVAFFGLCALYFLLGERKEITQVRVVRFKQALGVVFLLLALNNVYSLTRPKVEIVWEPYSEARLEQARAEGKPVMIDFTAKWCIACGELKAYTFTDPAVVKESERFVRLVVDATHDTDPQIQRILRTHEVVGLPTVIFIGSDGQERRELRLTGFERARSFLARMRKVE